MLKSINEQVPPNEGVIELDSINEQIQSLNALVNDKEVLDEEESKYIMEEAEKVLKVIDGYISYMVKLLNKIDYLKKDPTIENFPGLYQDLELRDHKVELVYGQLLELYHSTTTIVSVISGENNY